MSFSIVISPKAKNHTQDAYEYYELEQSILGDRFLAVLETHYDQLKANPQHYSFLSDKKDLRFLVVHRFPFVVVFQIEADTVFILDVFNTNQNPATILSNNPR